MVSESNGRDTFHYSLNGSGSHGLIIDIRGNPGGIGLMATGLAGMLVENEYEMGRMRLRQGHLNFNVYPQSGAFLGPVAILVDGNSISTSEIFAADIARDGASPAIGSGLQVPHYPLYSKSCPTTIICKWRLPITSPRAGTGSSNRVSLQTK